VLNNWLKEQLLLLTDRKTWRQIKREIKIEAQINRLQRKYWQINKDKARMNNIGQYKTIDIE
jgi:hypothetical protein